MSVSDKYLKFDELIKALNTIALGGIDDTVVLGGKVKPSVSKFLNDLKVNFDAETSIQLQLLYGAILAAQQALDDMIADTSRARDDVVYSAQTEIQTLRDAIRTVVVDDGTPALAILDRSGQSQQSINDQIQTPIQHGGNNSGLADMTTVMASLLDPSGKYVVHLTKGTYLIDSLVIPENTIVYANGAELKRRIHTNSPTLIMQPNSLMIGGIVDGNKDVLGQSPTNKARGIEMRRDSAILFCVTRNNARHGAYAVNEDLMDFSKPSANQKMLFSKAYNNGFNYDPAGSGTGDGFTTMNSDNVLMFGCEAWNNARTGFVATTYDVPTTGTVPSYSKRVQCHHCKAWGNGYSDFNFERVWGPEVSNIEGRGVTFSGSPYAVIRDITKLDALYAQEADYASVSNVTVENLNRSSSLFYLQGKCPQVSHIKCIVGPNAVISGNTFEVSDPETHDGNVNNVIVTGGNNGAVLRVANASQINVGPCQNSRFRVSRPEGSTSFGELKVLTNRSLEIVNSGLPGTGVYLSGDIVWNEFFGGSGDVAFYLCTTSGQYGTGNTPPAFKTQYVMNKANYMGNITGETPTKAEFNNLLSLLRSAGLMRNS